jgi:hypothetical protein
MKMIVVWDIALYSLEVDRRFRSEYCLHHQDDEFIDITLMVETVRNSETSVYYN